MDPVGTKMKINPEVATDRSPHIKTDQPITRTVDYPGLECIAIYIAINVITIDIDSMRVVTARM